MKTNVNIVRKLHDFDVIQRTKDGMFNATSLLNQWNKHSGQKKMVSHYLENNSTKEFIEAIENDKDTSYRNPVIIKSKANKGENAGTWMDPYLFIDFAMWLNPSFKLQVIKFLHDELIENRILSGDWYNKLCAYLSKFPDTNYGEVGKMLNLVVFNEHEKNKRNEADISQQKDLNELEKSLCRDIDMGYIRSWEQFKETLRKEWRNRHSKTPKALS